RDAGEGGDVDGLFLNEETVELLPLPLVRPGEEVENGEGQLALVEVGPQGLAVFLFLADEVDAVVVDLVGGPEVQPEIPQRFADRLAPSVEPRTEFHRGGEEGGGLFTDDLEVVLPRQLQVE